jgi:2-keto-4-pentenoate hydratase/2-oxohepta-3-ene-1,7-dioic acid hydratase in catechol pathway
LDYVVGYVLHNDVSEREYQLERGGTWDKGKGCDTFAPMGPFMATKEEIKDINNVRLWLKVNGKPTKMVIPRIYLFGGTCSILCV